MSATSTARERASAELTQEIKDTARRQLAEVGANGLSLRPEAPPVPSPLKDQTERLAAASETELPATTVARLIMAWTQLFGSISFELFGQFVGSVAPTDTFFAYTTQQMADFVGLRSTAAAP